MGVMVAPTQAVAHRLIALRFPRGVTIQTLAAPKTPGDVQAARQAALEQIITTLMAPHPLSQWQRDQIRAVVETLRTANAPAPIPLLMPPVPRPAVLPAAPRVISAAGPSTGLRAGLEEPTPPPPPVSGLRSENQAIAAIAATILQALTKEPMKLRNNIVFQDDQHDQRTYRVGDLILEGQRIDEHTPRSVVHWAARQGKVWVFTYPDWLLIRSPTAEELEAAAPAATAGPSAESLRTGLEEPATVPREDDAALIRATFAHWAALAQARQMMQTAVSTPRFERILVLAPSAVTPEIRRLLQDPAVPASVLRATLFVWLPAGDTDLAGALHGRAIGAVATADVADVFRAIGALKAQRTHPFARVRMFGLWAAGTPDELHALDRGSDTVPGVLWSRAREFEGPLTMTRLLQELFQDLLGQNQLSAEQTAEAAWLAVALTRYYQ